MRKTASILFGAMMLLGCATLAGAASRFPNGTCPDSVTIVQIQNPAATCHPAVLDTVDGVGGIITGFDAAPSAYGFYIQNRGVSAWAGIDVFTGATNYNAGPFSLAVGDSVVVYGRTQEFQSTDGESEIEGPDGTQASNDIVIRKVSSGNSLPAFTLGTVSTFKHVPTALSPGVAAQEQYEGMLVRVTNVPLIVRRVNATSTDGLFTGSFIAYPKTGGTPGDSVMIDMATLQDAAGAVPAVGTQINFLQGIVNQHVTEGKSTYRIQTRTSSDIITAAPPQLLDAYPIDTNMIRVLFDRAVTASSATNASNYSLTTLRDVLGAVQTTPTEVRLTIDASTPYADGETEGLTVVGVVSSATPDTMKTPDNDTFVGGIVTPAIVQEPDPAFLSGSCEDRSRFAGTGTAPGGLTASVRGVAIAKYGTTYYLEGLAGGPRNGLAIFAPTAPLTIGHQYVVVGQIQEFGTGPQNGRETELVSTAYIADEGAAATPAPQVVGISALQDTTCDNGQNRTTGEDYEGVLVKVVNARVTEQRNDGQSFLIGGAYPDTILVSNSNSSYSTTPDSASRVNITGVLTSNSLAAYPATRYRIQPRNQADIDSTGKTTDVEIVLHDISFAVAPNPARSPRITFGLPKDADVDLSVFDIVGRRVATLERGHKVAGSYSRSWDGVDDRGRHVRAGMFFYRLRVGDQVRTIQAIKLN